MRIRVILADGRERLYDVLEMAVVAAGVEPRSEIEQGVHGPRSVAVNVAKIVVTKTGPRVSWDPTGDAMFADIRSIDLVADEAGTR